MGFLFIADEVLRGSNNVLTLYPDHLRGREIRRQEWILAKAFEVAPCRGRAHQVHHGPELNHDALAALFSSHGRPPATNQLAIPTWGQGDGRGKRGDVPKLRHAGGTVLQGQGGQARHSGNVADIAGFDPAYELELIVQAECLEQLCRSGDRGVTRDRCPRCVQNSGIESAEIQDDRSTIERWHVYARGPTSGSEEKEQNLASGRHHRVGR